MHVPVAVRWALPLQSSRMLEHAGAGRECYPAILLRGDGCEGRSYDAIIFIFALQLEMLQSRFLTLGRWDTCIASVGSETGVNPQTCQIPLHDLFQCTLFAVCLHAYRRSMQVVCLWLEERGEGCRLQRFIPVLSQIHCHVATTSSPVHTSSSPRRSRLLQCRALD
jgi:hypothetical protein